MQTENIDKRSIVRNLIIFVLVFNALGWLGWLVASGGNTPEARDLGLLIWLVSPFLVSILIRLFSRDWVDLGLKPNFKGNAKGYLFSLLVFPVIVAIVVLIGAIFSGVSLANFKGGLFILAMGTAFLSTLIKNIFEEFAWRGYLTPKVNSLGINVLAGHLLVGLIWGVWHIPYYLGLLDHTQLTAYTSLRMASFLPLAIIGITLAGIIFGELRLISGSTWPAVLMHTVSNVVITTLLLGGYIEIARNTEILFTPDWSGIFSMILIVLAGLWLYKQRMQKAK